MTGHISHCLQFLFDDDPYNYIYSVLWVVGSTSTAAGNKNQLSSEEVVHANILV